MESPKFDYGNEPTYDADCGQCMKPETREAYEAKLLARQLRTPVAHKVWPRKHTNLTNEITGSYYKPDSFFDTLDKRVLVAVAVIIALGGLIYLLAF